MTEVPQSCPHLSCCAAFLLSAWVGDPFADEPDGMQTAERMELNIHLSDTKCVFGCMFFFLEVVRIKYFLQRAQLSHFLLHKEKFY